MVPTSTCSVRTALATLIMILALGCDEGAHVTISSPEPNSHVLQGDTVLFHGEVNSPYPLGIDVEGDWRWTSDIDGLIGTTALFARSDLSVGEHLITLRVENRQAVVLRSQVRFFVDPVP